MKQTELYNEVIAFMSEAAGTQGNFSTDILASIRSKNIRLQNSELYIRKAVNAAAGTQDLLEGEIQKTLGENLFDGNKLATGRYFVVTGLRFTYGTAATGTARALVDYSNNIPTSLLNAQVRIKLDANVLLDLPVKAIADAVNTDDYIYKLGKFLLLRDNKVINIEIRYPMLADLGLVEGKTGYIEVRPIGYETFTSRN